MSPKMPVLSNSDDCKSFDSAGWTDVAEIYTSAVEVHHLPSHGFRATLIKYYWLFPVLSGFTFLATQLGLILQWVLVAHETTSYATMHAGQYVPYLSDIGANEMKPLFITGFTLSAVLFSLGLTVDRWVVALNLNCITKWQRVRSILMIVCVWLGSIFLVLMTVFDTSGTHWIHIIFLVVFFFKYAGLAATFCWELAYHGYHERRILKIGFWFKVACIIIELALGITDGVMIYSSRANQGAIIEWVLGFVFFFFAITFGFDFHPCNVGSRRFIPKGSKQTPLEYIVPAHPVAGLKIVVKDAQFFPAIAGGPSFEVRVTFCVAEDDRQG